MTAIKSNQGYRQRPVTDPFIKAMRKLQGIMSTSVECDDVVSGPFRFKFVQDRYYSLFHDDDLIARWDCHRSKQYGAISQIEAAIEHLMPDNHDEIPDKALMMIKRSRTMLNNAITMLKDTHPNAGLSFASHKIFVLRDINQPETPENTLYKIPLAGAVRSIL